MKSIFEKSNKIFKLCLIAFSLLTFTFTGITTAKTTFTAAQHKVGLIDMIYVYENSKSIRNSNDSLAKQNVKIQKLLATANQEISAIKEKDPKSTEAKHKEIQAIIDKEVKAFYKEQKEASGVIQAKIETLLESFAREKSLELILDKTFVTSGGIDLTDEFLAKLDAASKAK